MSGTFFAVVGPSGAGKDTVIDYAREALADNHRFSFPQRWITRPADAGGEQHMPVSRDRFALMKREGAFLLDWEAHGLCYGVPAQVGDAVASGTHVVANLSRAVISSLPASLPSVHVVLVTASPDNIAARLAARGRESPASIAKRIERTGTGLPDGIPRTVIQNDGSPEQAGQELVDLLLGHSTQAT